MSGNGPIFIAGTDRAGKTLLSAILSSHPRISVPAVGSNLWTLFYGRFGDLADPEAFERCLAELLAYKHISYLTPDVQRLRDDFRAGPRTYARLFELLQVQYAERMGKPRWGDQTGLVEGYADEIMAAYPAARMVHMIRDPRDRYDASITMWPEGRLRVGGAVARWRYSARHAATNRRRYPDRYLVVRYEDLVRDPERTTRTVCEMVDEAYEPGMLELNGMPTYRAKLLDGRPADVEGPIIRADFVGTYRGRIPVRELRFLESRAAGHMRALGYELEHPRMTLVDRLRYGAVDLPLNLARMAAWNIRQLAAERFPRRFGKRPPAHHRVA